MYRENLVRQPLFISKTVYSSLLLNLSELKNKVAAPINNKSKAFNLKSAKPDVLFFQN